MITKNNFGFLFFLRRNAMNKNVKFSSLIKFSKINLFNSFSDEKNGTFENKIDQNKKECIEFEKSDIYMTLRTKIKEVLEKEKIVLFMKGSPEKPLCGFSANVVYILNHMNVKDYVYIDVMKNQNLREAIKIYSNWPYIPHLYVRNNFIGGYDIISELYNKGELEKILK
ncbi:1-cys-glutaredoxin-like protein-1, putative [Plasmodium gallinaceum]|uniref:1-cys-glutaredoxin-like protein-1, putative n=1 Tax=Plasmodium gallinaceum TaxID=5849 RepID=A0A1J1GRZ4_PLAGA|nr:1-cys-glutaredoxin-like protein-1, putative [Plasmodium gallinaceum]CRG95273.1 1-cys-glutaredoxin-like protein-1, putative [Plasmodium gallinaceum]